jgi:hypothetical protein
MICRSVIMHHVDSVSSSIIYCLILAYIFQVLQNRLSEILVDCSSGINTLWTFTGCPLACYGFITYAVAFARHIRGSAGCILPACWSKSILNWRWPTQLQWIRTSYYILCYKKSFIKGWGNGNKKGLVFELKLNGERSSKALMQSTDANCWCKLLMQTADASLLWQGAEGKHCTPSAGRVKSA